MEEEFHSKDKRHIRNFNLYVILICSILLILVGLHVRFSPRISKYYAFVVSDNPKDIGIANGPLLITSGLIMSVFPLYHLINKRDKENDL